MKLPWSLLPASYSETPQLTELAAPLYAPLSTGSIEAGFANVFSMTYGLPKPVGYPVSPTIIEKPLYHSYLAKFAVASAGALAVASRVRIR